MPPPAKGEATRSRRHVAGLSIEEMLKRASGPNPDPEAQYKLWWLSEGPEQYRWLCRAADQGHSEARIRIGILYESGSVGFRRDLVRTYVWYKLAAPEDPWAARHAERIRSSLSPNEIAEAERLLSAWEPGQCERDLVPADPD